MKTNDKKAKKRYKKVYTVPIVGKTSIQNIEVCTNVPVKILACSGSNIIVTQENLHVDKKDFIQEFDNTLHLELFYKTPDEDASLTVEIPAKSIHEPYSKLIIEAIETKIDIHAFISVKELEFYGADSTIISQANFKSLYVDDVSNDNITINTYAQQDLYFDVKMMKGSLTLQLDNVSDCTGLTYQVGCSNYDTKTLERPGPYKATGKIFIGNNEYYGID